MAIPGASGSRRHPSRGWESQHTHSGVAQIEPGPGPGHRSDQPSAATGPSRSVARLEVVVRDRARHPSPGGGTTRDEGAAAVDREAEGGVTPATTPGGVDRPGTGPAPSIPTQ